MSTMKHITGFFLLISMLGLGACEKVIQLDLPDGEPIPYVDAWITDQPGEQTISFLKAANYLDSGSPESISDATITVTDLTTSTQYPFAYSAGAYRYNPGATETIGVVGHIYQLNILYNGIPFIAYDTLKRNTVIDSLPYKYEEEDGQDEAGYYVKLYAKDIGGAPDYYWIRTLRNGAQDYHIDDLFSIDGAFDEDLTDGFEFIEPFRDNITSGDAPFVKGDSVTVVLRSCSKPSWTFLDQANDQIQNGGLFAKVLENVPTNLVNQQSGNTTTIYGWFGVVSQTSKSVTIE